MNYYYYICLRCLELCILIIVCSFFVLFLIVFLFFLVRYLVLCCFSGWFWIWILYFGTRYGNCWFRDKLRSFCRDRVIWFVFILGDSCICVIFGIFNFFGSKFGFKEEIILENKEDLLVLCLNLFIICKYIIDFFYVYIDKFL